MKHTIFEKKYHTEDLADVERDLLECFDRDYNEGAKLADCEGYYTIKVIFELCNDEI